MEKLSLIIIALILAIFVLFSIRSITRRELGQESISTLLGVGQAEKRLGRDHDRSEGGLSY